MQNVNLQGCIWIVYLYPKKTISYQVVENHLRPSHFRVMLIGLTVKQCWNFWRKIIAWCWYMGCASIQILMCFFLIYIWFTMKYIETCLFHALQLQTILNAPLDSQSTINNLLLLLFFSGFFSCYHKKRELVFRAFSYYHSLTSPVIPFATWRKHAKTGSGSTYHEEVYREMIWMFPKIVVPPNHPF